MAKRIPEYEKQKIVDQLNSNELTFDDVLTKYKITIPTLRSWLISNTTLQNVYFTGSDLLILNNLFSSLDQEKDIFEKSKTIKNKIQKQLNIYSEENKKLKSNLSKNIITLLNELQNQNKSLLLKERKILNFIKSKIEK